MKKKNFKLLNLNKKTVSILKLQKVKGGTGTDRRTMSGNTTGFVETDQCDG